MAGLLDYLYDPSSTVYSGQGGLLAGLTPNTGIIPRSAGFPQSEPAASFADRWNALPGGSGRSFDSATFDPATYAPSPSNPIAVGNYQMPRIGNPDDFIPQQVMTPPNATPTQGQIPAQQSPGIGDRLMASLQNFANAGGPLPAIAGAISGLATGVPTPTGYGQTDDIKEYLFARREDPTLTFQKFMQQKKAVSGEYGMQPIWGVDAQGRPAVIQLGKSGEAKQSVLPEGFSLARDPIRVEGPTGTTILDPQTRQPVQFIPKDVAEAAKQKEIGEARGQAVVNLPTAIANAEQTLQTIKSLKEDPYRQQATGLSSIFNAVPATGGFDYAQKIDQLKGRTFLEAFQALKGGGAITEIEGKKAEAAIARLNPKQSEKAFLEALNELEQVVQAGIERAKQKAGQPSASAATASAAPKRIRLNADGTIAQ